MIDIKETLKKYMWHLIVAAGYLLLVFFFTKEIWDFIKLVIGVLLGIIFIIADEEYLYEFYQDDSSSKFIVTRSTLYLLSLVPMALFVFTSSGSFLAIGMISGMLLFLITQMYQALKVPTLFFKKYFSLVRIAPTQQNMFGIFITSSLFFVILHFFVIL